MSRKPKQALDTVEGWTKLVAKERNITDPWQLAVLSAAAVARATCAECRKVLAKEGMLIRDRHGELKAHPAEMILHLVEMRYARLMGRILRTPRASRKDGAR